MIYTDSHKILSLKEYSDRAAYSLSIKGKNYIQINYHYGCCDGRYEIGTFYETKPKNLIEIATVLLEVDEYFYHNNRDKYRFNLTSNQNLEFEKIEYHKKMTISGDYAVIKMNAQEYNDHEQQNEIHVKFNVKLFFLDNNFHAVEAEDTLLNALLKCYYRTEETRNDNCYELYGLQEGVELWEMQGKEIIEPYLKFIEQLAAMK